MFVPDARGAKPALSSGCKPHPATLQPEVIGAVLEGNEVAEAFDQTVISNRPLLAQSSR
jgi:hypothetical protein